MILRRARLKFWIRCMWGLERIGGAESALYYWCARRAMACNLWRNIQWPKI